MKHRVLIVSGVVVACTVATGVVLGSRWNVRHVEVVTGRSDVAHSRCTYCHWVKTERMPWAEPKTRHAAPAQIAVLKSSLFVTLDELGEIWQIDTASQQVLRKAKVAGGPTGVVIDETTQRMFVACRDADAVVCLNLKTLQEEGRVDVGLSPAGLALCETKAGTRLVVANSGSHDISVLGLNPFKELTRLAGGREPIAVSATRDGSRAFVVSRLAIGPSPNAVPSSEVTVIDPSHPRVTGRLALDSAHLSEGVAIVPGRNWTLAPIVKVRNLVPITHVAQGWVMSSGLAVADAQTGDVVQVPLDEANAFFADPSGIAVSSDGSRAYVASGGSDAITVIDLAALGRWYDGASSTERQEAIEDLGLSSDYVIRRIPTGRNPRHLALSDDGKALYVAERLADTLLVVNTATFETSRIRLGDGGQNDPIRRGERVFTDASFTFQNQFSCRSCHPDGHVDGLSYDFDGDGIGSNHLDNRTLRGIASTGPFKWNGKNPSLEIQCGPRFARVLMRTEPFPPAQLKDLTAFIRSLPPVRTRKANEPLTPAQERGRQMFFATKMPDGHIIPRRNRCSTCHPPPLFTNRLPADIGSRSAQDTTTHFDTPHLLGIAASAPYLHDGRGQTLEELWTVYNSNDVHGVSSYMSKIQLNDLVEFLKTL